MENLDAKDLSIILWHEISEGYPEVDSIVLGVGDEFNGTPVPYIYHEVKEYDDEGNECGNHLAFTIWHTLIEGNPKYWAYLPMNNPYSREKYSGEKQNESN